MSASTSMPSGTGYRRIWLWLCLGWVVSSADRTITGPVMASAGAKAGGLASNAAAISPEGSTSASSGGSVALGSIHAVGMSTCRVVSPMRMVSLSPSTSRHNRWPYGPPAAATAGIDFSRVTIDPNTVLLNPNRPPLYYSATLYRPPRDGRRLYFVRIQVFGNYE